jgi:hypothetical protein
MTKEMEPQIADITQVHVTAEKLSTFSSEEDFTGLSVDLLVEVGSFVRVAACISPGDTRRWNRDQAIVAGNVVRLYKLISALLDQTSQRRRETTFIFARLAFEAIVNVRYLIEFSCPELFDSYIRHSLRHEKRLYDRIKSNIAARGGVLPIERRMLASIERAARTSGMSLSDVSANKPKNWGNKNLFERAKAVGLDTAYPAAFGGGSHTVHGSQRVWPLTRISFLDIDWRNSIVIADADKNAHHPVAAKAVGIKTHGADDSFDVREWDQIMRRGAPEARSSCNEILQPRFGQPLKRNLHRLAHWPVP